MTSLTNSFLLGGPSKSTLAAYNSHGKPAAGFGEELLAVMEQHRALHEDRIARDPRLKHGQGTLMFDEIKISRRIVFNAADNSLIGIHGSSKADMTDIDDIYSEIATGAKLTPSTYILQLSLQDPYTGDCYTGPFVSTVKPISAHELYDYVVQAIDLFHRYGFSTTVLVCDGNASNEKFYRGICGTTDANFCPQFFNNNTGRPVTCLFDNPHGLKNNKGALVKSTSSLKPRYFLIPKKIVDEFYRPARLSFKDRLGEYRNFFARDLALDTAIFKSEVYVHVPVPSGRTEAQLTGNVEFGIGVIFALRDYMWEKYGAGTMHPAAKYLTDPVLRPTGNQKMSVRYAKCLSNDHVLSLLFELADTLEFRLRNLYAPPADVDRDTYAVQIKEYNKLNSFFWSVKATLVYLLSENAIYIRFGMAPYGIGSENDPAVIRLLSGFSFFKQWHDHWASASQLFPSKTAHNKCFLSHVTWGQLKFTLCGLMLHLRKLFQDGLLYYPRHNSTTPLESMFGEIRSFSNGTSNVTEAQFGIRSRAYNVMRQRDVTAISPNSALYPSRKPTGKSL